MSARKPKSMSGRKALKLSKETLKDLTPKAIQPVGGFIMKDTIIIRTGTR